MQMEFQRLQDLHVLAGKTYTRKRRDAEPFLRLPSHGRSMSKPEATPVLNLWALPDLIEPNLKP